MGKALRPALADNKGENSPGLRSDRSPDEPPSQYGRGVAGVPCWKKWEFSRAGKHIPCSTGLENWEGVALLSQPGVTGRSLPSRFEVP